MAFAGDNAGRGDEKSDEAIFEHLFMGNTHSVLERNIAASKIPHIWSAFISLEPDRVVPPMTIKKVTYYLDPTFNRANPKVEKAIFTQKTPFKITHQGYGTFLLRAEIEFDPRCGPREKLTCTHMLRFDCPLSTTDTVTEKTFQLKPNVEDHLRNTDPITYLNKISNINFRERCSDLQNQCMRVLSLSNVNNVGIENSTTTTSINSNDKKNTDVKNESVSSFDNDMPAISPLQKIEGDFNDFILCLPKQQELKAVVKRLNANRLTGLPNRVAFRMWYQNEIERRRERQASSQKSSITTSATNEENSNIEEKKQSEARQYLEEQQQEYQMRPFGMIYMDISDLHVLNEIVTHQVMDEVIVRIANTLRISVDACSAITYCTLYHWDAGEFVVVMVSGTENELSSFAKTLITNVSQQQAYIKEPISLTVQNKISMSMITLCAGYALHSNKVDFGEWIAEADRGLELAKRQGPGSIASAARLDIKALTQELFKGVGDEYPAIGAILQSIRNGADLESVDKSGDSALAGLLKLKKKRPLVQTLIHQPFNPRLQDRDGNTHLMISMLEGWDDGIVLPLALQLLNPNLINNEGHTALDIALRKGYKSVVDMLSKYSQNSFNLLNDRKHGIAWFNACKLGKIDLLQQYIALGFPVDAFDGIKQRSGLAWACRQVQIDSVKFLLNPKTFEDLETASFEGIKLDQKTKNLLLEKHKNKKLYPANVNLGDQWNLTPLHLLLGELGREAVINQILILLLNAGADVNIASVELNTPLHEAVWQEHFEACKILIEKGANLFAKDQINRMPITEALIQWANPERKNVSEENSIQTQNELILKTLTFMIDKCTLAELLTIHELQNANKSKMESTTIFELVKSKWPSLAKLIEEKLMSTMKNLHVL